ncbi:hypothetical protein KDW_46700 [Dictyobacter vulcani]|uniref:TOTE conflict system primase domain-containing protein n=2 Tax=Dictyobacter vulcani TaxID=2607529 RepID=A0A5J4KLB8_9CHLR|nr:hypothetical protein KDW_46700 [Dictyobacter vulcani]
MSIASYLPAYTDVFVGRRDDYAIQLPNGSYRRAGRPLTNANLLNHLLGRQTYGTYVMDDDGQCRFAVFDADTEDGIDRILSIHDRLAAQGIVSYVERSRRGGHLWIFFIRPVPASWVRAWLLPIVQPIWNSIRSKTKGWAMAR